MGQTRETSMILCDVAAKHVKSCKTLENTRHKEFFTKIHHLFSDTKIESSLMDVLCDARIPLNAEEWKNKNDFWIKLVQKLKLFKKSQNVSENFKNKVKNNGVLGQKSFKEIIDLYGNENNYLQKVYAHLQILQTIIKGKINF